jgi:hypothetical protein
MAIDPIDVVWHYQIDLRGRALLELLRGSIEHRTGIKLTAMG